MAAEPNTELLAVIGKVLCPGCLVEMTNPIDASFRLERQFLHCTTANCKESGTRWTAATVILKRADPIASP